VVNFVVGVGGSAILVAYFREVLTNQLNGQVPGLRALDNKQDATYPLPMTKEVKHNRRRGRTRISGKHQVTLPVDALAGAGLKVGDRLRADVSGPGQITLVREDDPLEQFAGALTGVYPEGYLDDLRREWT
jgi:bifunctional DNA-binding transcriptional regulator/antitoxin component of YhaV-PrlF toxin-antitoxin module